MTERPDKQDEFGFVARTLKQTFAFFCMAGAAVALYFFVKFLHERDAPPIILLVLGAVEVLLLLAGGLWFITIVAEECSSYIRRIWVGDLITKIVVLVIVGIVAITLATQADSVRNFVGAGTIERLH